MDGYNIMDSSEIKPLDTQSFPIKKHWIEAALREVRSNPSIFSKSNLSEFRKKFLAGANQNTAAKNWLLRSELIEGAGKNIKLSDLGECIFREDPHVNSALSWWLFHIHLCVNTAFPYSSLFLSFDVDGNWMLINEVKESLLLEAKQLGLDLADKTINTYFSGVDASFRPGQMLYLLALIERRKSKQEGSSTWMIRRTNVKPNRELIVYTALLLHRRYFRGQSTVGTPDLLKRGFGKMLGMRDTDLRDQLSEMRYDKKCSSMIEYTRKQDLDNIHFRVQGSSPLQNLREYCYKTGAIKWK